MGKLRFGVVGAGFWARYQVAGWRELENAECVAICSRTRSKAQALANVFGIPSVYADLAEMLHHEKLDFIDIITDVDSHERNVKLAASARVPVVCQKPMASTLEQAESMVQACREARVPLLINENWRWQTPIRALKRVLSSGEIGVPFRARLDMISGFPVFRNQPFLAELEQFIITDLGSHILDVARFLFGETESVYCQTNRVHPEIKGEDAATVMMRMGGNTTVVAEMAYAENPLERECFPQTLIFVEGSKGSAEISTDYWLRVTTSAGTLARRCPPPRYAWADPAYEIVHSSIVPCQANLLEALEGGKAETTGDDNLETMRLVFACYESARIGQAIAPRRA